MDNSYKYTVGRDTVSMANIGRLTAAFNPAGLVIGHFMRDSHDAVRFEALANKQDGQEEAVPVNESTQRQREQNSSACLSMQRSPNQTDMSNCESVTTWLTYFEALQRLNLRSLLILALHLRSVKRNTYLEYTFWPCIECIY